MPLVAEVRLFDNSAEGDPIRGTIPAPRLLLHLERGRSAAPAANDLIDTPEWAKPIVAAALRITRR